MTTPIVRPRAQAAAERLRLLALDVDGTLTDGGIWIGAEGEAVKRFSVHDGFGLTLLRQAGIVVAIITGRRSAIVDRRAAELRIVDVLQGVQDKAEALRGLADAHGLRLEQTAFMGDDWPDLPAMRAAGLAAAPADADPVVREHADWVASRPGGQGAVREFAGWWLARTGRADAALAPYLADGAAAARPPSDAA